MLNTSVLFLIGLDCDCGSGLHCSYGSESVSEILGRVLLWLVDRVSSLKLKWIESGSIMNPSRFKHRQQQRLEERTRAVEGVGLRTGGGKGGGGGKGCR